VQKITTEDRGGGAVEGWKRLGVSIAKTVGERNRRVNLSSVRLVCPVYEKQEVGVYQYDHLPTTY
jgi:hypothetical protein